MKTFNTFSFVYILQNMACASQLLQTCGDLKTQFSTQELADGNIGCCNRSVNEPISPKSYLLSHAQEVSILALATISDLNAFIIQVYNELNIYHGSVRLNTLHRVYDENYTETSKFWQYDRLQVKLYENTSMGVDCEVENVNFNQGILEFSFEKSCELGMNQGEQVVLQLYEKHHPALPSHKLDVSMWIESVVTGRARNRRSLTWCRYVSGLVAPATSREKVPTVL